MLFNICNSRQKSRAYLNGIKLEMHEELDLRWFYTRTEKRYSSNNYCVDYRTSSTRNTSWQSHYMNNDRMPQHVAKTYHQALRDVSYMCIYIMILTDWKECNKCYRQAVSIPSYPTTYLWKKTWMSTHLLPL
jgi:hypothetical protein